MTRTDFFKLRLNVLANPLGVWTARAKPASRRNVGGTWHFATQVASGPRRIELATRDTPELLKKELARVAQEKAEKAEKAAATPSSPQEGSRLLSSIKSIFRRG